MNAKNVTATLNERGILTLAIDLTKDAWMSKSTNEDGSLKGTMLIGSASGLVYGNLRVSCNVSFNQSDKQAVEDLAQIRKAVSTGNMQPMSVGSLSPMVPTPATPVAQPQAPQGFNPDAMAQAMASAMAAAMAQAMAQMKVGQ